MKRIVEWLWGSKLKSRDSFRMILQFLPLFRYSFEPILALLQPLGNQFYAEHIEKNYQYVVQDDMNLVWILEEIEDMIL